MGCSASCLPNTTMSFFGKSSKSDNSARGALERKLYLAKESPEPEFDLSECELRHVPSGIYSICKVYRKENLILRYNNLQTLEEGGQLSDLYVLKTLDLSSNKFTQLPSEIRFLINLTELYIQDNLLTHLPEKIYYLQNLQLLDVSSNKLRCITPSVGKLQNLQNFFIRNNPELKEICSELGLANNIVTIDLDADNFKYPPLTVTNAGTAEIMKYLCKDLNIDYIPPRPIECDTLLVQPSRVIHNPFLKTQTMSWEDQEAAIIKQENKFHQLAKQQRQNFLTQVIQNQNELDNEISKIQEAKEIDRLNMIKIIQNGEKEINCLVKNFIELENLKPEVIQQQRAHEQAEHDHLLEIVRQNYDNVKRSDVLKAMETMIEEEYLIQYSKQNYEDSLNNVKQSMLMQELQGLEKMETFLKVKDLSRSALVETLVQDQDVQKALVASLVEKVDAKSWSLNQEISLISSHLARLSVIEQEKKKLQVACNYNELLDQRTQLLCLLEDLFDQKHKRRNQLIDTLKEMESEVDLSTDFWLKNYQKLIHSAPKHLLDVNKNLDPLLANYLLQEGVIHCLPFLVKFIFSEDTLLNLTSEKLNQNGVSLSTDREGILRAIKYYVEEKNKNYKLVELTGGRPTYLTANEDLANDNDPEPCSGVVDKNEIDDAMPSSECVICMDSTCQVVFIPCGHMCCCLPCSGKDMDNCPMCRTNIERVIKVIIP